MSWNHYSKGFDEEIEDMESVKDTFMRTIWCLFGALGIGVGIMSFVYLT